MDGYPNSFTASRQDARSMPLSTADNGRPISTAMLTGPKELKKIMNGTTPSTNSYMNASSPSARHSSEPLSSSKFIESSLFDFTPCKDDAYCVLEEQGRSKKQTKTFIGNQSPPARFDPRQLLDPKGFQQTQQRSESKKESINSISLPHPQLSPHQHGMEATHPIGLGKRDHEESELQGQGSLIEQMHNVTDREARPVKKRKTEDDEFTGSPEQGKAAFGGGKGGDLGQYMKDKRRQGQQDRELANAVVDLTGG